MTPVAVYVVLTASTDMRIPCNLFDFRVNQAIVLKLSAGDYFGEIALLSGKPRQASVKAIGTVTALVMSRDAFTRLCGNLFGILTC